MARLETTCGGCGARIQLEAEALRLVRSHDDGDRFLFACPRCGQPTSRAADPRHLAILGAIGVTVAEVAAPRGHPESPDPHAPALTLDDLLRFHELLQRDDWFAALVPGQGADHRPGQP